MEDKQTQGIPPWPMFEDGEPVRIGDEVVDEAGEIVYRVSEIAFSDGYGTCLRYEDPMDGNSYNFIDGLEPGKRVKRPPVLAADRKPLEVGQTVYGVGDGEEFEVVNIRDGMPLLKRRGGEAKYTATEPEYLTHARPVRAADGKPLEEGQTVYVIANGKTHHVTEVDAVSKRFRSMEQVDGSHWLDPMCFTHHRPVLDADGVEIREGDTVWDMGGNGPYKVVRFTEQGYARIKSDFGFERSEFCERLTHRAPVLASDGLPLREGDTVYNKDTGDRFEVDGFSYNGVVCTDIDACESDIEILPSQLTHTKPEPPDSWERIECDAKVIDETIESEWGGDCTDARDLVRRAKKLAGVSE